MKKIITKFYFDRATYRVGDDFGNEVFVEIDYKNGLFNLFASKVAEKGFRQLESQAGAVANILIKKKHNINFSDRIEI